MKISIAFWSMYKGLMKTEIILRNLKKVNDCIYIYEIVFDLSFVRKDKCRNNDLL